MLKLTIEREHGFRNWAELRRTAFSYSHGDVISHASNYKHVPLNTLVELCERSLRRNSGIVMKLRISAKQSLGNSQLVKGNLISIEN